MNNDASPASLPSATTGAPAVPLPVEQLVSQLYELHKFMSMNINSESRGHVRQ
jgi:hypothetical protein